jgi:hypothetical protein
LLQTGNGGTLRQAFGDTNIINQAGEEAGGIKVFSGTNLQIYIGRYRDYGAGIHLARQGLSWSQ